MERVLVDYASTRRLPAFGRLLALWHHRATSRRYLAVLDATALRDVGLTDAERRAECDKWFWQG
jgi:uncharacterized protein YjiS (DUF1127 family)